MRIMMKSYILDRESPTSSTIEKPSVFESGKSPILLLLIIALLASTACSSISLQKNNSLLVNDDKTAASASVYFIRPRLLKPKGYADNALTVKINDERLMEVNAGAYTLVHIKPGTYRISTHSMTAFTNQIEPIHVSRYRDYVFRADMVYFIYLKQINEEFRGVFYDPFPATLPEVYKLLDQITAYGQAQQFPVESVDREKVDDVDVEASKLPPAFPEDLYPKEKYLLQPSPFKR